MISFKRTVDECIISINRMVDGYIQLMSFNILIWHVVVTVDLT